jgi:ATP-dependent DNA ligase
VLRHACRLGLEGVVSKRTDSPLSVWPGPIVDKGEVHSGGSPFTKKLPRADARGVRFVRPELVAAAEFTAWTDDDLVRHAVFRGIRR